ncbi:SDR family oxidoreductase [Leifsonia sp. C5G2]|jgi:ketoreductase RED2|uniref:SDR family NAD(P)-dependent oxidoreductase n=1 Tax=Leifsonia sp. C5G2 TaxID=2735269 RepID=UPI001584C95C|nr:SDR family oxidoreductase [Leifsonia sp. C5G2]NUU08466.1 SDR family oxidoreductase [Leifsonia sp. C5G2]
MNGNPVALIFGGSSGIGLGMAERFADERMTVVISSRRGGKLRLSDGRSVANLPCDVSDEEQVARVIEAVEQEHGRLDVLVNSAGATKFVDFADLDGIDVSDWRRILDVNVIGAWNTVKAAAGLLEASPIGAVVNVASSAGIRVAGSSLPYSVSKAALIQLTRTLARALGPRGIRVNAVAPGFVATPWTAGYGERGVEVARLTPLGRIGNPADVAEMALALIRSDYVTGEVVLVDGGLALVD